MSTFTYTLWSARVPERLHETLRRLFPSLALHEQWQMTARSVYEQLEAARRTCLGAVPGIEEILAPIARRLGSLDAAVSLLVDAISTGSTRAPDSVARAAWLADGNGGRTVLPPDPAPADIERAVDESRHGDPCDGWCGKPPTVRLVACEREGSLWRISRWLVCPKCLDLRSESSRLSPNPAFA